MGPDLGQNCLQMLSADNMSDILMQKVKYNGFDPELKKNSLHGINEKKKITKPSGFEPATI